MQQIVLPTKDSNILKSVQETLLDSFRTDRRNYTIFQLDKATVLRVSDVMQLKKQMFLTQMGRLSKIQEQLQKLELSFKNTMFIE